MTDLHRILARLQPEPDGEPTLSRRTATLTAINGDGTVQINLSGVDVQARALSGWNMTIGSTVQVLVERGDLLVLGEAITPGGGFVTNITQDVMPFEAADTLVCMPHNIPFQPDPAHFQITARNDPGSTLHWWVDSVDLTDVCIQLDQAPGTDIELAWRHIGGPLPTGCAISDDMFVHDGWMYHPFRTAGAATLTVTQTGTFDVLIVAGGGGGGAGRADGGAGGGGAGGVLVELGRALNAGSVPLVVGAGGTGGVGDVPAIPSTDGDNSTFDTVLTAIGGGAGGWFVNPDSGAPGSGGSGGGGRYQSVAGGAGTPGQGHDGGTGASADPFSGGGGGGAGAPGTDGDTAPTNPAGGAGIYIPEFDAPSLGSPQGWFGGGGGGGRRGAGTLPSDGGIGGGGGSGAVAASGVDGTGGGGGGARSQAFGLGYTGGDGGDGIIVIRHPVCTP